MTGPVPLHLDTPAGWCFGWYHAPAAPWRDLAVVLCPPLGHEAVCSHPSYVQLARHLAASGLPVLRFDWHGTGDSDGDDRQPGRVEAWVGSALAAIERARALSGATHVALVGLRAGATLALEAAARAGGVDSLLLWAPCASGRAFTRELRAAGVEAGDGTLLAMGHAFRADTLADLAALDPLAREVRPAARAWLVGRDDLPAEGPLPARLRSRGVDTRFSVLPGYGALVGEPREGAFSPDALAQVVGWLCGSPAAQVRTDAAPQATASLAPRRSGAVLEGPWQAGTDGSLFGVLARPVAEDATDRAAQTGIVLLNVGGNHHVGPHRVYVGAARTLAEAGYRVLRLDLAGIGDSPPAPGKPWASLYDRDSVQDVRSALDALAAQGCREFVLMGICSGSYVAFQSALADPRVDGLVLMNSRLLEWTPGKPGDTWQNSMQQYAKSTAWYRRALFQPEVWGRLLRGQVNVRLIAGRFAALAVARLRRLLAFRTPAGGSLLGAMKRLVRRGTDVLMLVSDADDGRDYVEFHFGADGRRLRSHPNFRMAYVPEADHTFSRPGNQAFVFPLLLRHLRERPTPARRAAPDGDRPGPAPLWPEPAAGGPPL